jgi:hypothetical protein
VEVVQKVCTDNIDLDVHILQAQRILLNPSAKPNRLPSKDELMFTKNVVCVELYGQDLDLSLIDLPGIIHNYHDARMISLVEELVKDYIARERALILAAITCKDEIENQAIFHYCRQVDPTGLRTIGVLTKPDTIEKGTHDKWVQILLGNQYQLRLGYYMCKLPDKSQLKENPNLQQKLESEKEFFSSNAPWSLMKINRFGVPKLRSELNHLLTRLIESSLPEMKKATQQQLEQASMELDSLPPPIGKDYKIELLQTVRHFSTITNYHLQAQQNLKVFHQKVKKHYESLKENILSTRPTFSNEDRKEPSSFWKRSNESVKPPKKDASNVYYLDDLRAITNNQKGKELDGYSPYGALEFVVKKSQQEWTVHVELCLQQVARELLHLSAKLSSEVFGRFPKLHSQIGMIIQVLQNDLQRIAMEQLNHTLQMEMRFPFTMNSKLFLQQKQEHLDTLLGSLVEPQPSNLNEAIKKALNALSEVGIRGLTPQSLMSRVSNTQDQHLYDLMASSMSYFDISSTRTIDQICLQIDYHFLNNFGQLLEKELVHSLGILDGRDIEQLLVEDAAVVEKREILMEKQKRLEQVWKRLSEFGFAY